MEWNEVRRRLLNRERQEQPKRRSYVSIDEVPCATAALELFPPLSRPMVVAYRRRAEWIGCAPSPSTHAVLAALVEQGACEVELRWRARRRFVRLPGL